MRELKDISAQVGLYELHEKLSVIFSQAPILKEGEREMYSIAQDLQNDTFIQRFQTLHFVESIRDGLYFDGFVPRGCMAVKQKAQLKDEDTTVDFFCFGRIESDFEDFFNRVVSEGQALTPELNFFFEGQMSTLVAKGVKKQLDYVLIFFKDVTVEKQLNDKYRAQMEELKATYAQVLQFDKLKVIGEMTANISHEINNPLQVLMSHVESLQRKFKNNKDFTAVSEQLNTMDKTIDKMAKLIRGLRNPGDFSG
jgi:signal transduction histidine kinase